MCIVTEKRRIADNLLSCNLKVNGAVLLDGPRGCGKSSVAKKYAKSVLDLSDRERGSIYAQTAKNDPDRLLPGEPPRLFVEWQNAPEIWDSVRNSVDEKNEPGLYILTGQDSNFYDVHHSGVGRFSIIRMLPMSLYESGESTGEVSMTAILDDPGAFRSCRSELTTENLIDAVCRGGWPECVCDPDKASGYVKALCDETCRRDVPAICGGRKSADVPEAVIRAYAKNLAKTPKRLYSDLTAEIGPSYMTLEKYVSALKQLCIVEDVMPWKVNVRDRTHRVMTPKCNLADPSLSVCALGLDKEEINLNHGLLSDLFECLCYRDVKVYGEAKNATIYYYKDRYGLEVDCVLCLRNGRYALIDFALGVSDVEKGVSNLNRLEKLISDYDKDTGAAMPPPAVKILLTGTEYGYRRSDGILVIPAACLKD